jgi:hypothetical protein
LVSFSHASRGRLTDRDLGRFAGTTLFDRLGRAVCHAGCLPRKELYEAWETARRVRRLFRGGRVVDLAGGHGLLAHAMLLLDDSSPRALVVDPAPPPSGARLHEAIVAQWPRLRGRVTVESTPLERVALGPGDVAVSIHACGSLTDVVLERSAAAGARVAVLPCCHRLSTQSRADLAGWVDGPLAMDIERAVRLRGRGYRVWTQTIPREVTPKNRLLIAAPR